MFAPVHSLCKLNNTLDETQGLTSALPKLLGRLITVELALDSDIDSSVPRVKATSCYSWASKSMLQ